MHQLDFFIKNNLRVKYYIRYADDFVILSTDYEILLNCIDRIRNFLNKELLLILHPKKISIRKNIQGIDFLGYVLLPHYKVLRTNTKRRIFRKFKKNLSKEQQASYFGVLSHCKGYKVKQQLKIHR
ncbi:MAG: hypothetical protein NT068_03720 [Candidatus Nomurabacteria bacterium]|nr:hypothetical protein [Candidatus Nomurabacteria bacterium]